MTRPLLLTLLGVTLIAFPLRALCAPVQNTSIEVRQRAIPRPDQPPAFDVLLLPVRTDVALDAWHRTQPGTAPQFATVREIVPFDEFMPLVTLHGIGAGADGAGHVSLRVSTVGADGKSEVLAEDIPAWDGKVPAPGLVVLSQTPFGLALDDEEELGPFKLIVEAHDSVSGANVRREAELKLVPWTYGETPADDAAMKDWFTYYYKAPQPSQAVRAYLECSSLENEGSQGYNVAVLNFFREVFADKPWLVDHLTSRATNEASPEQLFKICLLLHLLAQDSRIDDLAVTAEKRAAARAALAGFKDTDPYAEIRTSDQLDMLWGEFLATGRYAPFRQLVSAFRLRPFKDALDGYKSSAKTPADTEAALKGATFDAAVWSVGSNLHQHPLLVEYGLWMLTNEKLSTEESALLGMMLAKEAPDRARVHRKGDPDEWPADKPAH